MGAQGSGPCPGEKKAAAERDTHTVEQVAPGDGTPHSELSVATLHSVVPLF